MKQKTTQVLIAILIIILLPSGFISASETDGIIDPVYKYAWSENIGWINFATSGSNVVVTDSGITGYAWSANYGWINLNPSGSGISNNGEGVLSGSAWGENTGWIDFSGVTINSSGYFGGYASGTITGSISFNCANTNSCGSSNFKVRTDWRPQSVRTACNNSLDDDNDSLTDYPDDPGCSSINDTDETDEIEISGSFFPPLPPAKDLKVTINNNANTTNSRIVNLSFGASSDIERMAISNTSDFADANQENYRSNINWNLCSKFGWIIASSDCPEKTYTVYVKFYARYGPSSKTVSDSIIYKNSLSFTFTRNLELGNIGNDVKKLQEFLNQNSFIVAQNGLGSLGNETEYFGSLTKKALIKFQDAYTADILAPIGLSKGTGFFGPSTIRFIKSFYFAQSAQQKQGPTYSPARGGTNQPLSSNVSAIFTHNLEIGTENDDNKRLQQLLATLEDVYPEGIISGYFGTLTEKAVQRFQLKYNVVDSSTDTGYGYVGPATRTKLGEIF